MSWVSNTKRWAKQYRGTSYSVSCRQLRVPPTKVASWQAANGWWENKRSEIDGQREAERVKPGTPEARSRILEAFAGRPIGDEADAGVVMSEFTEYYRSRPLPPGVAEALLGVGEAVQLQADATRLLDDSPNVATDRTIGGQAAAWLSLQEAAVAARSINAGRYDSYRAALNIFKDWCGARQPVEFITPAKVELFHAHLLTKVGQRMDWERHPQKRDASGRPPGYSAAYAHTVLGTMKMFVTRLAEHGLVTLPGNLKRMKIAVGKPKIETFSVDELKSLLGGCKVKGERTALYLLLMMNCGMYQSDISDLAHDEVDWKAGTITRPRSKTPDGPMVRYKLWPETLALLKRYRNTDSSLTNERGQLRVIVTAAGRPLVPAILSAGRLKKCDNVQSAYRRLTERLKIADPKPLKLLRKTSASLLARHPQYKFYTHYFLAHSPRSMAERHYIKPDDKEFFEALDWLREQYELRAVGKSGGRKR